MHPAKQAEEALAMSSDVDVQAKVFAILALGQAIEGLSHDISEALKTLSVEHGEIAMQLSKIAK